MNYAKINTLGKVQKLHWPRGRKITDRTLYWDLSGNSEDIHFFKHDIGILDLHQYKFPLVEALAYYESGSGIIDTNEVPISLLEAGECSDKSF